MKKNSLSRGKETHTGPGRTENPKHGEPKVCDPHQHKPELKWQKLEMMTKFGRQQEKMNDMPGNPPKAIN